MSWSSNVEALKAKLGYGEWHPSRVDAAVHLVSQRYASVETSIQCRCRSYSLVPTLDAAQLCSSADLYIFGLHLRTARPAKDLCQLVI